jgi:HEAT repeat protein
MLQESEPRAQEAARCALIDLGKLAVSHLSALLRNPQLLVTARREACIGLGHIGDPDALPALLDCQQDPDAQLCQWIAWALGKLPVDERLVQALVKLRSRVRLAEALSENLIRQYANHNVDQGQLKMGVSVINPFFFADPSLEKNVEGSHLDLAR